MEKEKVTNEDLAKQMVGGFKNIEGLIDDLAISTAKGFENTASKSELMDVKTDVSQLKTDVSQLKTDLRDFKQETRQNFEEVNEKLDLVIEDVAGHSERIEVLEGKR